MKPARPARLWVAGAALACCTGAQAAGELIDLKPYWPQPEADKVLVIRFDSGRFNFYRRAPDGFTLGDYWHKHTLADEASTLLWSSTWRYRVTADKGVVEYQDDVPGAVPAPLAPGYEIQWGSHLRVGETLENKVMFAGASAPFGHQKVTLAQHWPVLTINGIRFEDVIRLDNVQIVCKDSQASTGSQNAPGPLDCPRVSNSHSKLYLAKGRGIVRIEDAVLDDVPNFVRAESVAKVCEVPASAPVIYCK